MGPLLEFELVLATLLVPGLVPGLVPADVGLVPLAEEVTVGLVGLSAMTSPFSLSVTVYFTAARLWETGYLPDILFSSYSTLFCSF